MTDASRGRLVSAHATEQWDPLALEVANTVLLALRPGPVVMAMRRGVDQWGTSTLPRVLALRGSPVARPGRFRFRRGRRRAVMRDSVLNRSPFAAGHPSHDVMWR
jgi:hypothetical protein